MKNRAKLTVMFFLSGLYSCELSAWKEATITCKEDIVSQNFWLPHPFTNSGVREILILQEINIKKVPEKKKWINVFGLASEYIQSFGKDCGRYGLGALPFWSGTNQMTIGTNNGKSNLDAYQFGLGETTTEGLITLTPLVKQMGVTFVNYTMQNKNAPGLYIKARLSYGAMFMHLVTDEIPAKQNNRLVSGQYPVPENRYKTITEAFHGGYSYQHPLYRYGKIPRCGTKDLGVGDTSIVGGYNFIVKQNAHCGIGMKFLYPLGTWPYSEYMLEPIFGSAGHVGLGMDISAHYSYALKDSSSSLSPFGLLFSSSDDFKLTQGLDIPKQSISFWLQSEIMHLFPGRKPALRSFDLAANGPGSRYLLIQEYEYNIDGSQVLPVDVAQHSLQPAINYTTLPVLSTFPVEGNCTVMVNYRTGNIEMGVSAELWCRSKESLHIDSFEALQYAKEPGYDYNLNRYAVVGRQIGQRDATFWCQPGAKINKSVPYQGFINEYPAEVKDARDPLNRIPQDYNLALDIEGARIRRIVTGKMIAQVGYTYLQQKNTFHGAFYGGVELAPGKSHIDNMWSLGVVISLQY